MDRGDGPLNPAVTDETAGSLTRDGVPDLPAQDPLGEYEEELPIYLGLLENLPPSPSYDLPEDELRHMPKGNKDSAWQNCLSSVEKFDRDLCQTYREQIDTLLVFAGLFSAVVTAFVVESYQWLQDDPHDASVELLRDVVTLLSQTLNVTSPPPSSVASPRISGSAVARINTFWFLSLSLSLSAALVGILCKQWLREYERNVGQSPEKALAIRYVRFQGLEYWGVGSIVMSVPIIMQMALAFFMIGIIDLLWRLHAGVAFCVTVVAGLTVIFFLATTFLPVIQYAYIGIRCCVKPLKHSTYSSTQAYTEPQCAFKSPQAWLAFRVVQPVIERLLKAFGHQFTFRRPPHDIALVMRPADSWITFDLNWINRREHIHHGPRCAFECLAWMAKNLGETHLSSWIWHCVWARWLRNRQTRDSVIFAATEIQSVVRSYPSLVPLGPDNPPRIKVQALVFQCSLCADLPIETAIELLLRVAPVVGVNSQWAHEAIHAVHLIYQDLSIHINDGLAVELFRLAEMQTHALILNSNGPNDATQLNAALAFKDILIILYRGSRLREPLLMAMSGLVLQWLRSNPPTQIAYMASLVFNDLLIYLGMCAYNGIDLHQIPGIMLAAKLADTLSRLWPQYAHFEEGFETQRPYTPRVMRDLLAMLPDDSHDPPQAVSGTAQSRPDPIHDADAELSTVPVIRADIDPSSGEETHAMIHDLVVHACETSQGAVHAHLSIDVRVEAEPDATGMEIDLNCAASPVTGPVAPQAPSERDPVPPGRLSPPTES